VVGAPDPPDSFLRIPVGSLPRAHLLHAYAQDKYHECIRGDTRLMNGEQQVTKHHWIFVDRVGTTLYSNHFKE
jgi:hypothetical protein